jgi:cobalt/nickel transport protein
MVLISMLKRAEVMKHTGWETDYRIKRPGVYQFFMEPQPYWEPAEDCYIVHYTKAVVTDFGAYS